jgi:hypothetical protein
MYLKKEKAEREREKYTVYDKKEKRIYIYLSYYKRASFLRGSPCVITVRSGLRVI